MLKPTIRHFSPLTFLFKLWHSETDFRVYSSLNLITCIDQWKHQSGNKTILLPSRKILPQASPAWSESPPTADLEQTTQLLFISIKNFISMEAYSMKLAFFIQHNAFEIHPSWSCTIVLFYCPAICHCIDIIQFVYSFTLFIHSPN